jgi:hypothetical protein
MHKQPFNLACLLAALSLALVSPAVSAQSLNDKEGYTEIWQKSQSLRDQFSADQTPLEFSVGGVHYRVPRNYIVSMEHFSGGPQSLVAFMVSFPGFKPYSDETKDCFTLAPLYRPKGCIPIAFDVIGSTPVSDEEGFRNASKLFHSKTPKQGPNGFDLYETGPDSARLDTYSKFANGHLLVIDCFVHDLSHERNAVCRTQSRLPNRNALNYIINGSRYFFNGEQFQYAEQLDAGIRSLIESFTLKGDKP